MFCLSVTFDLHPPHAAAFISAVTLNARSSLEHEPGCRQFDVCLDASGHRVLLYELYDDEAAFLVHLATPHFARFDALVAPWVAAKAVQRWRKIAP